ncbi:MAG: NAD kinase [Burkholderiaceae bacterium]|jgi:NAD+ kinase|nr:NAD kinase [Burkholderiaceae bacterium]
MIASPASPLFQRVALVGKHLDPAADSSAKDEARATVRKIMTDIAACLAAQGCAVHLEAHTAQLTGMTQLPTLDVAGIGAMCDLCVVAGGDGTMLGIGRQLARFGTPLVGINQGRLGFITDIALDEFRAALPPILAGEYEEDLRALIQGQVWHAGRAVFEAYAMNDVAVHRGASTSMVELRVEVDGHFVANHRADGIIVATPTGSTAYALSAGGPLLHPQVPAWTLVPIAPHALSNRPIVLPAVSEIAIEIISERKASASFDTQSFATLHQGDRIVVRRSAHRARFLHPRGWNYFDTLRRKLLWNERCTSPS